MRVETVAYTTSARSLGNVGALIVRTGLGAYDTTVMNWNPQNPIPIVNAPTLGSESLLEASRGREATLQVHPQLGAGLEAGRWLYLSDRIVTST